MGASESRSDVPVITIAEGELDEDGRDAGFAADLTSAEQHAADQATAACAALNIAPSQAPKASNFVVQGGTEGEPLVTSLSEYRMDQKVLGEGAFGKVKLATSTATGHQVAVKIIKRNRINERAEELLKREVSHHEKLRHANIVRLHTWIKAPTKYYLVMEYCAHGDLLHHLNSAGTLRDDEARGFFRGTMQGIAFCHGLGIHHRDIKLENLMLSRAAPAEALTVKIADFGLSDLRTSPLDLSGTFCGSPLYAAPELMTEGAAPNGYDASRSDIWSCGVVLYALLCSALPFDAGDMKTLVRLVQRGEPSTPVPRGRGGAAKALVARMMHVVPAERPAASEVLADAWLAEGDGAPRIVAAATVAHIPAAPAPADADDVPAEHRRGASETTQFFKRLMAEAGRRDAAAPAAPAAAEGTERKRGQNLTRAELDAIRAEREREKAIAN